VQQEAAAPADYAAAAVAGKLNCNARTTELVFSVSIVDDALPELDETILVRISGSSDAAIAIAKGEATVTIADNDAVQVSLAPVTEVDGPGSTGLARRRPR
jgi:hypothetical protein